MKKKETFARPVNAHGIKGKVYTSPKGMKIAVLEEYAEAWMQVTPTQRKKVVGKRFGHSSVGWAWWPIIID